MKKLSLPLALLVPLSRSPLDSVSAFAQRSIRRHPCIDDPSSSSFERLAMSSLRTRGGGGRKSATSTSELSSAATNVVRDDDVKSQKIANGAHRSMRKCCAWCIASILANVVADAELRKQFFGRSANLAWVIFVDVFDSLSMVVFAGGMWRISSMARIWTDFGNWETDSEDGQLSLFRTMAWMWGVVALNHYFLAVSMADAMPTYGGEGWLKFVFDRVSSYHLSSATVGILGISTITVSGICKKTAIAEVKAYRDKHGMGQKQLQQLTASKLDKIQKGGPKFDAIREAAYGAYRNQALCAVSFAVMTILQLAKWIVSFDGDFIGHFFSVTDILTPLAITSLLLTLNKALVRAGVAAVTCNPTRVGESDKDVYQDLFVAQTKFYDKVARYLKSAAIFLLLPKIAAPAIPYILKAMECVSPAFYAKVTEAFNA